LDWSSPLSLDAVIARALALFEATLPRALGLALAGACAVELASQLLLAPVRAELDGLVQAGDLAGLAERFGGELALLALLGLAVNSATLHLVGTLARGRTGDAAGSIAAVLRLLPQLAIGFVAYLLAVWCGVLLLVVPGMYLLVAGAFWNQALLFDGAGPFGALSTSLRLTRGAWWRSLGLLLLCGAVMLLAMLVAGLIGGLGSAALGALGADGTRWFPPLAGAVVGALAYLLLCALQVAYYHDLGLRAGRRGGPGTDPTSIAA
jgi:hypothetical protein